MLTLKGAVIDVATNACGSSARKSHLLCLCGMGIRCFRAIRICSLFSFTIIICEAMILSTVARVPVETLSVVCVAACNLWDYSHLFSSILVFAFERYQVELHVPRCGKIFYWLLMLNPLSSRTCQCLVGILHMFVLFVSADLSVMLLFDEFLCQSAYMAVWSTNHFVRSFVTVHSFCCHREICFHTLWGRTELKPKVRRGILSRPCQCSSVPVEGSR